MPSLEFWLPLSVSSLQDLPDLWNLCVHCTQYIYRMKYLRLSSNPAISQDALSQEKSRSIWERRYWAQFAVNQKTCCRILRCSFILYHSSPLQKLGTVNGCCANYGSRVYPISQRAMAEDSGWSPPCDYASDWWAYWYRISDSLWRFSRPLCQRRPGLYGTCMSHETSSTWRENSTFWFDSFYY